ncbi:hypothetical protein F4604DRAFT_1901337 [Suillus subluteus]|nr:hypothetical protein F4604DRAFT_1901337 [Suillus subluteus]
MGGLKIHAISPPHTLDPAEERENGDLLNFEGGDQAIADKVRHKIAVANGEVVEIDSDDESEEDGPSFTRTELFDLCQRLETGCMQHGDPQEFVITAPLISCSITTRGAT